MAVNDNDAEAGPPPYDPPTQSNSLPDSCKKCRGLFWRQYIVLTLLWLCTMCIVAAALVFYHTSRMNAAPAQPTTTSITLHPDTPIDHLRPSSISSGQSIPSYAITKRDAAPAWPPANNFPGAPCAADFASHGVQDEYARCRVQQCQLETLNGGPYPQQTSISNSGGDANGGKKSPELLAYERRIEKECEERVEREIEEVCRKSPDGQYHPPEELAALLAKHERQRLYEENMKKAFGEAPRRGGRPNPRPSCQRKGSKGCPPRRPYVVIAKRPKQHRKPQQKYTPPQHEEEEEEEEYPSASFDMPDFDLDKDDNYDWSSFDNLFDTDDDTINWEHHHSKRTQHHKRIPPNPARMPIGPAAVHPADASPLIASLLESCKEQPTDGCLALQKAVEGSCGSTRSGLLGNAGRLRSITEDGTFAIAACAGRHEGNAAAMAVCQQRERNKMSWEVAQFVCDIGVAPPQVCGTLGTQVKREAVSAEEVFEAAYPGGEPPQDSPSKTPPGWPRHRVGRVFNKGPVWPPGIPPPEQNSLPLRKNMGSASPKGDPPGYRKSAFDAKCAKIPDVITKIHSALPLPGGGKAKDGVKAAVKHAKAKAAPGGERIDPSTWVPPTTLSTKKKTASKAPSRMMNRPQESADEVFEVYPGRPTPDIPLVTAAPTIPWTSINHWGHPTVVTPGQRQTKADFYADPAPIPGPAPAAAGEGPLGGGGNAVEGPKADVVHAPGKGAAGEDIIDPSTWVGPSTTKTTTRKKTTATKIPSRMMNRPQESVEEFFEPASPEEKPPPGGSPPNSPPKTPPGTPPEGMNSPKLPPNLIPPPLIPPMPPFDPNSIHSGGDRKTKSDFDAEPASIPDAAQAAPHHEPLGGGGSAEVGGAAPLNHAAGKGASGEDKLDPSTWRATNMRTTTRKKTASKTRNGMMNRPQETIADKIHETVESRPQETIMNRISPQETAEDNERIVNRIQTKTRM